MAPKGVSKQRRRYKYGQMERTPDDKWQVTDKEGKAIGKPTTMDEARRRIAALVCRAEGKEHPYWKEAKNGNGNGNGNGKKKK